jgi:NAD(P)-dependent dehydrogenase (short-subunit alcohol dehydrogenase family)
MDLGLQDQVVVVTGASKGIGLAVVSALVAEGAQVVAGARRSSPELDALQATGRVRHVAVDLSDPAGPPELAAAAADLGVVEVLVNNVGAVTPRTSGFLAITDEEWLATLGLTLLSAVRMTRAVLPGMLAAGRGSVVTVSSVNAFLPDPGVMDYSAAKAALSNFSKALSKEVGGRGIRVNTVSPGPVATDLWLGTGGVAETVAGATGGDPQAVRAAVESGIVTGRFSTPVEVADLVVMLAGMRTGNVTGADFVIDGGLVSTL